MNQELIAVDLDDVVVDTAEHVIAHYNTAYGTTVTLDGYYQPNLEEIWSTPDRETAIQRVNGYLETEAYYELTPAEGAIDALDQLKKRYQLMIVTGRPNFVEEATHRWLSRHFPDTFTGVQFTNFYGGSVEHKKDKGEICRDLGVDILIDDHSEHALSAAREGIKALLFGDYPWNQVEELPPIVERVKDWAAVLEYFDGRS